MNILSQAKNNFAYDSDITISFKTKGRNVVRKLKNSGTQHLFDVICQALAGYDISRSVPYALDVKNEGSSVLRRTVPLTGIVWGNVASETVEPNTGYLKLTATLINSDKTAINELFNGSLDIIDKDKNVLCTISGDTYKDVVAEMWESITVNTDAIIEWILIFRNNGGAQ